MSSATVASWDEAARECAPSPEVSREGGRTIVSLSGEHDHATTEALVETLAAAISLEDVDLVVDLADVEFMDSSTLDVLVRASEYLRRRDRALVVRAPSASARRVIDAGGLGGLIADQYQDH